MIVVRYIFVELYLMINTPFMSKTSRVHVCTQQEFYSNTLPNNLILYALGPRLDAKKKHVSITVKHLI